MPKLNINTQSKCKNGYEFTEDVITIGRAPDNMVIIEDGSVSSRHAQMEREGDSYRLKDLGSTNGTRVNGLPVKDQVLRFEDKIRFGGVESRFESDVQGSAPLPEPEKIDISTAETSAAPVDFANSSPFPKRKKEHDPLRMPILAGAAVALLAFFISIIAVLMMQAPVL